MNFLADESVDYPVVERLRADGHTVTAVAEMAPSIPDDLVLAQANQHEAILLTGDKDFGELVFRQRLVTAGVVLIRLAGLAAMTKAAIVATVVQAHEVKLHHAFTVISPGMVRIRSAL